MFHTTTCEQKPHDEPNNKKIIKVNNTDPKRVYKCYFEMKSERAQTIMNWYKG